MEPYELLEVKWAEFNGLDPEGMVVCSSGTAALHLALETLDLESQSRVVVPDFTMVACARAVALADLAPTFIDCRADLLMDTNLLTHRASRRAVAVMPVHIYGRRVDMDRVAEIGEETSWFIIEDLAEAHGIKPHPGTDVACWSFYKNKVVAGEEGGACWFASAVDAKRARCLRSLGFTEAHDFMHVPRGHNYRLSNCHAELILESLKHYESNLRFRRWAESTADRLCPEGWRMPAREVPWVYDFRTPGSASLDEIVSALVKSGIPARHSFKPMRRQLEFRECGFVVSDAAYRQTMSESDRAAQSVMYFPLTPGIITEDQLEKGFEMLKQFFKIT